MGMRVQAVKTTENDGAMLRIKEEKLGNEENLIKAIQKKSEDCSVDLCIM